MTTKHIVLITGANSGIGFELACQLLSDSSKHVLLGCRSAQKGEAALKDIESRKLPGSAEVLQLDVSSEESIHAAAKKVEASHGRLDTLVNNAASGILNASLAEQMAQAFQTNATGPLVMAETFVPLLQKSSSTHRIINVTSGAGSIGMRLNSSSPSYNMEVMPYRSSKAALNMIGACLVAKYPDFKIFTYCPGFCVSNLSDMNTAANGAKPTSEGSAPIVPMVNGERDAEAGRYLHSTGEYPW